MTEQPEAIRIDSVACTSCDHRWWPAAIPMFPESYVCPICTLWLRAFEPPDGLPGRQVHGPVKSVRKLLADQPLFADDIADDDSAMVCVITRGRQAIRWDEIMRAGADG